MQFVLSGRDEGNSLFFFFFFEWSGPDRSVTMPSKNFKSTK